MSKDRRLQTNSRRCSDIWISIGTLIVLILFFCMHTIIHRESFSESDLEQIEKVKNCYKSKKSHLISKLLENILKSPPKNENNIFFIDTACATNGTVTLTSRY